MRRFARLLLKSFLAPFAVTLPVALFILDMQFLWVYADDLIGKGLEPWIIAELMIYASARLVNLALPLAILVASIMAFGALAERNELTALKSAGLSIFRIFRPLMITMILISIGAFWFSNAAWPVANLKFRTLLFSVTQKKPTLNLVPGVFYNGIEGFAIRTESKNDDGTLNDLLIHDHREGETGVSRIMRAESGSMAQEGNRLILTLSNGHSYEEDLEQSKRKKERLHPHISSSFELQSFEIDLASLDFSKMDEGLFKRAHEMMTIHQLNIAMDSLEGLAQSRLSEIQLYGDRQTTLLRDTLSTNGLEKAEGPIWEALTPTQNRLAFDAARSLARNARQGIANGVEDAKGRRTAIDRHAIEWHRKFFLALSCVLLFFIGAPLGAIIRKGGLGMPTVLAISIFLGFYILSMVGEQMVKVGTVSPWIGMWMSSLILLPFAVLLTIRAMRDANQFTFNLTSLANVFKNFSRQ
ncbi:MAG: LptF/LptG family permease [Bacteroidetes bacterium]|nr:LptF/LptG family permease [Bacteroidota bacterium]MDA1336366.1 LptF/LptG family permease [Bacteroidota bacterium]